MGLAEVVPLLLIAIVSFGMSYIGAAVGMVLGQLRVALLTYVLGSAALGVSTSLAISTLATIAGTLSHARSGRVQWGPLLLIGVPSGLAAYATASYTGRADPRLMKLGIAVALLFAGGKLLRQPSAAAPEPRGPLATLTGRIVVQVVVGTVLGAISGLVGLLLGTLRLPAMLRFAGMAPSAAVGTNMAIGALTGLSAGFAALTGGKVHPVAFAIVCPITLLGAHFGAQRTGRMDKATVRRWIGYVLVPTALIMVVEVAASTHSVRKLASSGARTAALALSRGR